jgi:hypothetical protein
MRAYPASLDLRPENVCIHAVIIAELELGHTAAYIFGSLVERTDHAAFENRGPMVPYSPARRVCRAFMRGGLVISILAFIMVGSNVLVEQWISGQESVTFMLGTAGLIAGTCVFLFAVIVALGVAISYGFSDNPPPGPHRGNRHDSTIDHLALW